MTVILDAAALIALDRNERAMWTRLKSVVLSGDIAVTHGGVLGQVWRGGPRQARLAQALAGIEVRPLDEQLARAAGELLAVSSMSDVIDAAVVLLSTDGDTIVTSDLPDLERLVEHAGRHVELISP